MAHYTLPTSFVGAQAQIEYAALDAWASREVALALCQLAKAAVTAASGRGQLTDSEGSGTVMQLAISNTATTGFIQQLLIPFLDCFKERALQQRLAVAGSIDGAGLGALAERGNQDAGKRCVWPLAHVALPLQLPGMTGPRAQGAPVAGSAGSALGVSSAGAGRHNKALKPAGARLQAASLRKSKLYENCRIQVDVWGKGAIRLVGFLTLYEHLSCVRNFDRQ
jgi:hypothetical protein